MIRHPLGNDQHVGDRDRFVIFAARALRRRISLQPRDEARERLGQGRLPQVTSTRTPTIGYPRRTPFAIDSLMPLSSDVMKRFGIAPSIVVSSKL